MTATATTAAPPRKGFPRTFWIANVMELFERAAYYGMNSVLAVYLTRSVAQGGRGFSETDVGLLTSVVYAATYVLPILGGALADRYGYRRMLMVAFSLLAAGYFATGFMSSYALVFLALLVMATGAGLFKPIISGTIARTTDETNSAFGFGIYYWLINVGAFLAPLVVSVLKGFSWKYVFLASCLYTAAMLLPTLFLYADPPRPPSTKKLKDVLMGAVDVLGDARFMLMIVIYSGFWILYFQQFGSILWYLGAFVDRTPVSATITGLLHSIGLPWTFVFDVEHVTVIDAGMIILLQVFVSRIVKNRPALPTMISGMVIGGLGFVLLAASRDAWVFASGIAVFAIGEMTAHPKYYSFVGLVAPADRKAVYMGYAFLYGVFGALLGASLGSALYTAMLKPYISSPYAASQARLFWLLFVALDACAVASLLAFSKRLGEDTADTRRIARIVMYFVYLGIAVLGASFLYVAMSAATADYKKMLQAIIFLLVGLGGLLMNRGRS